MVGNLKPRPTLLLAQALSPQPTAHTLSSALCPTLIPTPTLTPNLTLTLTLTQAEEEM